MSSPPPDCIRDRDLRAITADGVAYSVMVGMGEAYLAPFALAIGLGDIAAGLLATVPMLLGACLQLVTPFAVRRLGSYRRWVVGCARVQALSFLPLVAAALAGGADLVWVAGAAVLYWAAGLSTGPAWNAWVTSLVPLGMREEFFARRTRAAQAALFAGLLAGGLLLEAGRRQGFELLAFAALFALAFAARVVSSRHLASQSEQPGLAKRQPGLTVRAVWSRLRASRALRVLRYLLVMQIVTNIAAPYFAPYMLSHLELSYGAFVGLTASAFLARVAVLPLLGALAKRHGAGHLLWLGGLGIVPLPALWLLSDELPYLLAIQLVGGCAWAAIELATLLSFFDGIEEDDRASVLTVFNLANALAMAVGAGLGAWIMGLLDASPQLYGVLFLLSTAGRLGAAALLRGTPVAIHLPRALRLRTLAVRPAGIAVQRPILSSLEGAEGEMPERPARPDPDPGRG